MKKRLSIFIITMIFTSLSNLTTAYQFTEPQAIKITHVSTELDEYSPSYDVINQELFFMRRNPGSFFYTIFSSTKKETGWTEPQVASFSGTYRDDAPYISQDGNTLFFDSRRPHPSVVRGSINIWKTIRTENGWSDPEIIESASYNAPDEPESGVDEYGPAIDSEGNLFFYSFRSPYRPGKRISASIESGYQEIVAVENIPDPSANTFASYISFTSDGKTAVIEGRHPGRRDTGLFYSCMDSTGKWSEAALLPTVNSRSAEGGPFITADGDLLFFSSNRPATGVFDPGSDIYMISTENLPIPCE
jgi:hypothetical protein